MTQKHNRISQIPNKHLLYAQVSLLFDISISAMALDKKIGNFECGKEFDALIVDPDVQGSPMNSFEEDTALDVVEKFLYTGRYSV